MVANSEKGQLVMEQIWERDRESTHRKLEKLNKQFGTFGKIFNFLRNGRQLHVFRQDKANTVASLNNGWLAKLSMGKHRTGSASTAYLADLFSQCIRFGLSHAQAEIHQAKQLGLQT